MKLENDRLFIQLGLLICTFFVFERNNKYVACGSGLTAAYLCCNLEI